MSASVESHKWQHGLLALMGSVDRICFTGMFIVLSAIMTSPIIMLYAAFRQTWRARRRAKRALYQDKVGYEKPLARDIAKTVEEAQLQASDPAKFSSQMKAMMVTMIQAEVARMLRSNFDILIL
eukprot:TRINITY_DN12021_c0_g1_i2.p1 TRINITY_DN12021_c0_g1~~TRINITY_DN12021_c0_g1_i2.p1  ORF type:complete len:124 (+),score=26.38 TRINITY_DN12021_c0_g1_i2:39-410(+)